jgi:hypothetical protein
MARGCLIAAGILVALLVAIGVFVGPTVYREGKAVVEPVVEMARTEDALEDLEREFPFAVPDGDAGVTEERLQQFLSIRHELEPVYAEWRETIERVEQVHGDDSWVGAKEALTSTRDVISGQISALRSAGMSPAEFRWLEKIVYRRWLAAVGDEGVPIGTDEVRALTAEDIEFVRELERRHGKSPALDAVKQRLEARLITAGGYQGPAVAGIAPATLALFWKHRQEIARLDLRLYELHQVLLTGTGSGIRIEGGSVSADD